MSVTPGMIRTMWSVARFPVAGAVALLAASCAGQPAPAPPREDNSVRVPANAGVYKVGQPYQIDNVWYYPREQPDYDESDGQFGKRKAFLATDQSGRFRAQ